MWINSARNIKHNANIVLDSLYLQGDGQNIRILKCDGTSVSHPISCLRPVDAEEHERLTKKEIEGRKPGS